TLFTGAERRLQLLEPLKLNAKRIICPDVRDVLVVEEFRIERSSPSHGKVHATALMILFFCYRQIWRQLRHPQRLRCMH
ncbi:hypothetical protein LINPERHAP1_LOCUS33064, partial [Linum perenne]